MFFGWLPIQVHYVRLSGPPVYSRLPLCFFVHWMFILAFFLFVTRDIYFGLINDDFLIQYVHIHIHIYITDKYVSIHSQSSYLFQVLLVILNILNIRLVQSGTLSKANRLLLSGTLCSWNVSVSQPTPLCKGSQSFSLSPFSPLTSLHQGTKFLWRTIAGISPYSPSISFLERLLAKIVFVLACSASGLGFSLCENWASEHLIKVENGLEKCGA